MKNFVKNDQGFKCVYCNKTVQPLKYTSRNHCNYCLRSLHVDNVPGDRQNTCGGIMHPISAQPDAKKGFVLYLKCANCGAVKPNKCADDDDIDTIIALTAKPL